jgi:very-short-patch-repair endonuclease
MILKNETKEKYGYDVEELARTTVKPIWVRCDYCGKQYESSPKRRDAQNKILAKDACKACKGKKREEISIIKYGVKNPFQREDVKDKIRLTNKEKYGVEWACQSEEVKGKIKDSIVEKYGVSSAAKVPEVREKMKATMMERYGVENASQYQEFQDKKIATNMERYGASSYIESDTGKERIRRTNQEKYGVDNVFQDEGVKSKIKLTHLERRGIEHHMKDPEVAKMAAMRGVQTKKDNGDIELYHGLSKAEWADIVGYSRSRFTALVNRYGFDYAVDQQPNVSSLETCITYWLDEIGIKYEHNRKKLLNRYFPDIIIGSLIIECDGLYWHCDKVQEDRYYHKTKRDFYVQNGYTPLFFREDEIRDRLDIVKSMILHRLGRSEKIGARKLSILKISPKLASEFCDENHLMGRGRGGAWSLHDGKDLLCMMRGFTNRNGELKIDRFCCKRGYSVVGGFSRLLKKFVDELQPSTVINMIDLRYGHGEHLSGMGFELANNDLSFKWTNGQNTFHRMNFKGNSGYDQGLAKIWDCGQAKYIKTR